MKYTLFYGLTFHTLCQVQQSMFLIYDICRDIRSIVHKNGMQSVVRSNLLKYSKELRKRYRYFREF